MPIHSPAWRLLTFYGCCAFALMINQTISFQTLKLSTSKIQFVSQYFTPWSRSSRRNEKEPINDVDAMYDDHEEEEKFASLETGLRYFREYAKRAINRFQEGNIEGAVADFNRAVQANCTQPLQQRGMVLYIAGDFEQAERQFVSDIAKLEEMGEYKATDLRIWHSACLNRLNRFDDAKAAIDIDNTMMFPPDIESLMMSRMQRFYAGTIELEEVLDAIGSVELGDIDAGGRVYYGNFYLGLHFDSLQQMEMSQVFLSIPCASNSKSKRDMWYHIPRALYKQRFPATAAEELAKDNSESGSDGEQKPKKVNRSGLFF